MDGATAREPFRTCRAKRSIATQCHPQSERAGDECRRRAANGINGDLARTEDIFGLNRDEVQAVAWIDERTLRREVAAQPERFTPWLRIYLDRWSELSLRPAA